MPPSAGSVYPAVQGNLEVRKRYPSNDDSIKNGDLVQKSYDHLDYYESKHPNKPLTPVQKHVLFWDRDCDGIIRPQDVYNGFRELGFNVPFSIGSLLIPFFFSYPTSMGHGWLPDPFLRIYVDSMHKAKHGSDTGIYNPDGDIDDNRFEHLFNRFDESGTGSLGVTQLFRMMSKNRCAADPAGWTFSFMEWWTTWALLQKNGRVWKDDLKACYDGSLFWRIRDERLLNGGWNKGYGLFELCGDLLRRRTWHTWGIEQ